ncbi:hypothetical protein Tco_0849001, partial [Tanacetum coccineum]
EMDVLMENPDGNPDEEVDMLIEDDNEDDGDKDDGDEDERWMMSG